MGEWSKTVGEKGEKIVDFFFKDILGYKNILHNETIECIKGTKHKVKTAKGDKNTHGIDALISSVSPLEDNILDVGYISSKFTSDIYPNSPKSKFKDHLIDLAHGLECYKNSELSSTINQTYSKIKRTEVTGILVWASNKSPKDENIISKLANIQLDADLVFDKIIVIDNNRLNFFVETIQLVKKEFGKDNVKFIYHNTGINSLSLQSKSYGDFLPIQYLFSDIIPLRIERENKIELLICSKDEFSSECFGKVLDFAKSFDHLHSITSTTISFPNYNELDHKEIIKKQLVKFEHYDFQINFFVKKHIEDFKNY